MRAATVGPLTGHATHVRDMRRRFGDAERWTAECSCGWTGVTQSGFNAERLAKRDATVHVDYHRLPTGGHPMTDETDEPNTPVEPPDAEPDHDEGAPGESSGTSTSDLPEGATGGELPPAP